VAPAAQTASAQAGTTLTIDGSSALPANTAAGGTPGNAAGGDVRVMAGRSSGTTRGASVYTIPGGSDTGGIGTVYDGTVGHGSGTVFPTSPATGERFWRTDEGIEWYWNGTYWLSCEVFLQSSGYYAISSSTYPEQPSTMAFGYNAYLLTARAAGYNAGNTAAAYWTFQISRRNRASADTTIGDKMYSAMVAAGGTHSSSDGAHSSIVFTIPTYWKVGDTITVASSARITNGDYVITSVAGVGATTVTYVDAVTGVLADAADANVTACQKDNYLFSMDQTLNTWVDLSADVPVFMHRIVKVGGTFSGGMILSYRLAHP
jgi:hypothetical protein